MTQARMLTVEGRSSPSPFIGLLVSEQALLTRG
jgi:hypothetical protein